MKLGKTLIARLGSFSRKKSAEQAADLFDLRLQRIGNREGRVPLRPVLFKSRSELLAV